MLDLHHSSGIRSSVLLEASPLDNGHATRGIGRYAAGVIYGLEQIENHPPVRIVRQVEGIDPIRLPRIVPSEPWGNLTTSWKLLDRFERALPELLGRSGANVLHLLEPLIIPRPRPGLRMVATVQDLIPLLRPEHRIRRRQDWGRAWWHYHKTFLGRLARLDRIIVPSMAVAEDVAAVPGVERERIVVIHHGADEARVPTTSCEGGDRSIPSSPFFLFVGAADKRKNIENVIRALVRSGLPHKLVLAGRLGDSNVTRLQECAVDAGAFDRLVLTGFVDDAQLSALYRRADALVFPSLAEGFGLPVVEAMREECPVITSSTGCLPEVAGDAGLLVDPVDVGSIARAMRRVAEDESLRDDLRRRGKIRAGEFRWRNAVERIVEVWNEL